MYKNLLIIIIIIFTFGYSLEEKGLIDKGNQEFNIKSIRNLEKASKPVLYENGILFTFYSKTAKNVYISASFFYWSKVKMFKNKNSVFVVFVNQISFDKGDYKYRYMVDSFWVDDPHQDYFVSEKLGFPVTGFRIEEKYIRVLYHSPESIGDGYFRFYLEDKGYSYVSLVGNRNNWDPYVNIMKKKRGIWSIVLKMNKDLTFYKFYVDGRIILDSKNESVTFSQLGESYNYISNELWEKNQKIDLDYNPELRE